MIRLTKRLEVRGQTALQYAVLGRYIAVRENEFQNVWKYWKYTDTPPDTYKHIHNIHILHCCNRPLGLEILLV